MLMVICMHEMLNSSLNIDKASRISIKKTFYPLLITVKAKAKCCSECQDERDFTGYKILC